MGETEEEMEVKVEFGVVEEQERSAEGDEGER